MRLAAFNYISYNCCSKIICTLYEWIYDVKHIATYNTEFNTIFAKLKSCVGRCDHFYDPTKIFLVILIDHTVSCFFIKYPIAFL